MLIKTVEKGGPDAAECGLLSAVAEDAVQRCQRQDRVPRRFPDFIVSACLRIQTDETRRLAVKGPGGSIPGVPAAGEGMDG